MNVAVNLLYKIAKIIAGFFWIANIFLFVRYYIIDALKINFQYPAIEALIVSIILFFIGLAFGIIVPSVLFFSISLIYKKSQEKKKNIMLVSVIPIIVLLVFNSFCTNLYSEFFALAGFYSHTDDVSDYGKYDEAVEKAVTKWNLEEFLPSEDLVKKYGEYDYQYEYFIYKEHIFMIEIDIRFPDSKTYDKEVKRILSINSPTEYIFDNVYCDFYGYNPDLKVKYYEEYSIKPWEEGQDLYLKTAIFDDDKKTIKYVIEYDVYGDSALLSYLKTNSEINTEKIG